MAFGKFGGKAAAKTAAPAKGKAGGKPAAKKQSMWAKYAPQDQKAPLLEVGSYIVRVGTIEKKIKPAGAPNAGRESFHAAITVEDAQPDSGTPVGDSVNFMSLLSTSAGQDDVFRFVMAAAGCETVEEYQERFNPNEDGAFMEAVLGEATNEYNEDGPPLEGRLLRIDVAKGKPVDAAQPDGDWYRNYRCMPVDEEHQGPAS